MNDHETFLLLAAKRMTEPLTHEEETELERHLASCPDCRAIAAAMRRDDLRLRAELTPVPVAPRVRERVLAEAAGSRRSRGPVALLLAAALALALMAVPLISGRFREPAASESPSASTAAVEPSVRPSPTASTIPPDASTSTSAVPPSPPPLPPGTGPVVNASYRYGNRTDSVAARLDAGKPVGEWWRQTFVNGKLQSYGGPITCMVVDGKDAWLAGPATTATDGRSDLAILFRYHDGGPSGDGDRALGYLSNPGQTLKTMQTWCETRYTPTSPNALTSGEVSVDAGR